MLGALALGQSWHLDAMQLQASPGAALAMYVNEKVVAGQRELMLALGHLRIQTAKREGEAVTMRQSLGGGTKVEIR